jgi:hypothetical protein
MDIQQIVMEFDRSSKWVVHPPSGLPKPADDARAPDVAIPDEVLRFYESCGGLESVVQEDQDLILSIASPKEFNWALPQVLGRSFEEHFVAPEDEIEWYWYVIGRGDTNEYFVIDLATERYGRCYFAELYFFGQRGRTPIVADSFYGLLQQFYKAASVGENWSWGDAKLGDAYD